MTFPILSTGACLPRRAWSNAELISAKNLDSSPDWIESRTGIKQRHMAEAGETTFSLARNAVELALGRAGVSASDVGVLVVATCTPDLTFPSVAAMVHGALGMRQDCAVLDINAACSGFIHALAVAKGLLMGLATARYAVIVGAETFSNLLDWNDRTTCVLFGDGAGAVVMAKEGDLTAAGADYRPGTGLLGVTLGADGRCAPMLCTTHGVARGRMAGHVVMNGREVFRHAVRQMGEVPPLLADLGLEASDIDLLVPHQANARIIEAAAKALDLPMDKVIMTVDRHANTSAASIPLALHAAVEDGRLTPGKTVLLQAFGAGFAWSTALVKW